MAKRGVPTLVESVVRCERWIILSALFLIFLLSWIYLLAGAGTGMSTWAMSTWQFPPDPDLFRVTVSWDTGYWIIMVTMWWVMMIAMMVPSATPMILLYARVYRHGQSRNQFGDTVIPTSFFAAGYLLSWLVFSLAATALQWAFEKAGLVDAMMMWSTSTWLTAGFLVVVGLYQLTPLKHACLSHCRSPVDYLSRHWRKGRAGALQMGFGHGLYCVGCCWFLMCLLFAGGIMNLVWIAGLAIFVLLEKLAPFGPALARGSGVVLVLGGLALVLKGIL